MDQVGGVASRRPAEGRRGVRACVVGLALVPLVLVVGQQLPAAGSAPAAPDRMRSTSRLLVLIAAVMRANPARSSSGSRSASGAVTWGRSGSDSGWSSPAMDTSRRASRTPSFDENRRYTVAAGTSAALTDGVDRGRLVVALEEEGPGGVDHGTAGKAERA